MRKQPDAGVLSRLQGRQQLAPRLTISAITVDEIMFGLACRPTARLLAWFDAFLLRHEVLPVTHPHRPACRRVAGSIDPKSGYPANSRRSGGSHGGNGRVIFATT